MRTGKVTINDKEYLICMSTRVLMGLEEKGLTLEGVFADGSRQITNVFTLLALMIDAGDRWARMNGQESPGTLSIDDLMDSTAIDQYADIVNSITATVASGRNIEATPPKRKAGSPRGRNQRG